LEKHANLLFLTNRRAYSYKL